MAISRHLGRTATHRKNLLRNLVTDLLTYESITTTHAKAKETQQAAEWLITLAKNRSPNVQEAKNRAINSIYKPSATIPKLFDDIATRYKNTPGGYTRILKLESRIGDNAPQSILELVGGKKDMRMAMTARTVARLEKQGAPLDTITKQNVANILRYTPEESFRREVDAMKEEFYSTEESIQNIPFVQPRTRKGAIKMLKNPLSL